MTTLRILASVCLLALVAIPATSPAKLGETEEESADRYGPPLAEAPTLYPVSILPGSTERVYSTGDGRWFVRLAFEGGKVTRQVFQLVRDSTQPKAVITPDQVRAILSNESGTAWVPVPPRNPIFGVTAAR